MSLYTQSYPYVARTHQEVLFTISIFLCCKTNSATISAIWIVLKVSSLHQTQVHQPFHTIALPLKQGIFTAIKVRLTTAPMIIWEKADDDGFHHFFVCRVWWCCDMSFAVFEHNSATNLSYWELHVLACCYGQREMMFDGFRMFGIDLLGENANVNKIGEYIL